MIPLVPIAACLAALAADPGEEGRRITARVRASLLSGDWSWFDALDPNTASSVARRMASWWFKNFVDNVKDPVSEGMLVNGHQKMFVAMILQFCDYIVQAEDIYVLKDRLNLLNWMTDTCSRDPNRLVEYDFVHPWCGMGTSALTTPTVGRKPLRVPAFADDGEDVLPELEGDRNVWSFSREDEGILYLVSFWEGEEPFELELVPYHPEDDEGGDEEVNP